MIRVRNVDDSLRFYFEMLAPGTLVEGAALNLARTSLRFHCPQCEREYQPNGFDFLCPSCGTLGDVIDDGSDLLIESLEIET